MNPIYRNPVPPTPMANGYSSPPVNGYSNPPVMPPFNPSFVPNFPYPNPYLNHISQFGAPPNYGMTGNWY